jgi:membrane peptidoglycan carboxypeptidase
MGEARRYYVDMPSVKDKLADVGAVLRRGRSGAELRLKTARSPRRRRRMPRGTRIKLAVTAAALIVMLISTVVIEIRTSFFQSIYFSNWAGEMTFAVHDGPSQAIVFPETGPHDERLGYVYLPKVLERLVGKGFRLASQARLSPEHLTWARRGLYPLYREKTQAGLVILDGSGQPLFSSNYPQLVYDDYSAIPSVITRTLLFIENRDLLDERYPRRNPVIEWNRLGRAVIDMLISQFVPDHDVPGGSTLATQIEKYRHSPEGRTDGVKQKAVQMLSATLRSYLDGPDTMAARRRIITGYINSVPLGAVPGGGEVRGIGHGMMAWHGADFAKTNKLLVDVGATTKLKPDLLAAKARAYKEVLSLFLAQRRPAYYLQTNRDALRALTDKHLPLLVRGGVISADFAAAVAKADLTFRNNAIVFQPERQAFVERKAANAVRVHLLQLFGMDRLYSLDRLDLSVTSTIDYPTQKAVTEVLQKLRDPEFAAASALKADRLLAQGDPSEVIYSFTLRERVGAASVLRVQADNVDGPFNVSEGGKLELGSTAKLRTLVSYLETIEAIWRDLQRGLDPSKLPNDRLTLWVREHMSTAADKSLKGTLAAAMLRLYSASPAEAFFTGSGQHRFSNFAKEDNARTVTVLEALRKSINLPFVRMMRDIVQYHVARVPGSAAMMQNGAEPRRKEYLARFANKEGRLFLGRFYLKYRGKSGPDVLQTLLDKMRPTQRRLAAVMSVVKPEADAAAFAAFVQQVMPNQTLKPEALGRLLAEMKSDRYTLQDKGYVAGVHPLELWLVSYMYRIPTASYSEVLNASDAERQEAYGWLFNSKHKSRQDTRIRIMLEQEAFLAIHQSWARLGYPFGSLVPTYATALGSSGDRPTALAELVGIILSDGMRYPNARIDALHFAAGTPYETRLISEPVAGEQVMSKDVAQTIRGALREVVDTGTAIRVKGAFAEGGKELAVGGKTGTGDNRYSVFAPGGRVIESRVKSRTATFVFYIGDRFYGTVTAYVPTENAGNFNFTSALPVQILKILAPKLMPLVGRQASSATAPSEKVDL